MKLNKIAYSIALLSTFALGTEQLNVNMDEVASYTAQKYRVSLDAQNEQGKAQLVNEYLQTSQLADALASRMKDDVDLKVVTKLFSVDIWAKKYMQTINPSEEDIKKVYEAEKPKTPARYNLRTIIVKEESTADKLIKQLSQIKDASKQLTKFKELAKADSLDPSAKTTEGAIGFVEINKLDPNIQTLLKDKKSGDLVKMNIPQVGWQILFVEEFQGEKIATLEESKSFLISAIRQNALKNEINRLLTPPTLLTPELK